MLNLFRHLTGKRSLAKDLCLSASFDVRQMLKQLKNQELQNTTKKQSSCRNKFGMTPAYGEDREFCANGRVRLYAQQGLAILELTQQKQGQQKLALYELVKKGLKMMNLKPTSAFSVAEAMIALLIGTLVLGFSAPMITKQLKHNDFTSIQTQILNKKIENVDDKSDANAGKITGILDCKDVAAYVDYIKSLDADIATIKNTLNNSNLQSLLNGEKSRDYDDIESLQSQLDEKVDSSTLNSKISTLGSALKQEINNKFEELKEEFKSSLVPKDAVMAFNSTVCPSGWLPLTSVISNSAGVFIRNTGGGAASSGVIQQAGVPNIKATWLGPWENANQGWSWVSGSVSVSLKNDANAEIPNYSADRNVYYSFDASKSSSIYQNNLTEVRPKNVAFLYCVKK